MQFQYIVGAVVVAGLIALRLLRFQRGRAVARSGGGDRPSIFSRLVRVDRLWIVPTLTGLSCIAILAISPRPNLATVVVWLAALAVGSALGWLRGKSLRLEVHPETAEVRSHAGGAFAVVIVVLVLLRAGLRIWLVQHPDILPIGGTGLTEGFLVMAVGIVAAQRLEMWLRARRLLAERTTALAQTFS